MKKLHSYPVLYLLLLIGLISWPGCDDDDPPPPPPTCEFEVPLLGMGDYCEPRFLDFANLAESQAATIPNLPSGCISSFAVRRTFTVEVPAGGDIYLHRYRNFPANVIIEVFGTNCEQDDFVQIACIDDDTEAIVGVHSIDGTGYTQLIIRASAIQTTEYVPGSRATDELNFAVFDLEPNLQPVNAGSAGAFGLDCQGRPNRLILSPGPTSGEVIETAIELGLPYRSCDCDANLVVVEVPNGINLDKLRPKVPESSVGPDTTKTGFDFFIEVPIINPTSFNLDPNDDFFIGQNDCLSYDDPIPHDGTNPTIRVAIVDSGVDFMNIPVFENYANPGAGADCISEGVFGYDILNNGGEPSDQIGHGTAVASTFLRKLELSGGLSLRHYKFFGPDGGSLFDALCGTVSAVNANSQLINLSWGFRATNEPPSLTYVLDLAEQADAIVVVSAGNNGQDVLAMSGVGFYFPAAAANPNVLTVASYSQIDVDLVERIAFSNFNNPQVDLAAFYAAECQQVGGGIAYSAGTSISAPIVTRRLAEIMSSLGALNEPQLVINTFFTTSTISGTGDLPDISDSRYLPIPTEDQNCAIDIGN